MDKATMGTVLDRACGQGPATHASGEDCKETSHYGHIDNAMCVTLRLSPAALAMGVLRRRQWALNPQRARTPMYMPTDACGEGWIATRWQ